MEGGREGGIKAFSLVSFPCVGPPHRQRDGKMKRGRNSETLTLLNPPPPPLHDSHSSFPSVMLKDD